MNAATDGLHYRACNLCEAICGLQIRVEGGRVVDLRGDPEDPLSHGAICPKGSALIDLHNDPDRLKGAMRRVGTRWEEIAWDEAFDIAAAKLGEIARTFGPEAIASYQGNPSVHNSGTLLGAGAFLRALHVRNRYSATSVDQLPHHVAAAALFGHPMLLPIPDIDRTMLLFAFGANPLASQGSIMTAPGMRERLRALRERGGRFLLFDPRRTESAGIADEHFHIRPGSDALVMLAMLQVLFSRGLLQSGRLGALLDGVEGVRAAVAAYTPARVAERVGIAAEEIERVAVAFATTRPAVAYGRMGASTQEFGGLCQWLLALLNALTGNLDEVGGAMFPLPAFDLLLGAKPGAEFTSQRRTRVRALAEFNGEFPVAALAEEIATPGVGRIRALVTIAGNPVLSTPNGRALDRALESLDFMLAIDPYINETTRHADIILPPAIGLETEHYDAIFHHFAVRNTARWNDPVLPIAPEQRYDWQIFEELSRRSSGRVPTPPRERIELALQAGPRNTSIDELRRFPHGRDFGALTPSFPDRLLTANGRIDLAPSAMLADLARLERAIAAPIPDLVLIGRRELRNNNSWMHNAPRLMRGEERCTLLMHPQDAARYGIEDGAAVEVRSAVGSIETRARIDDSVMPGVASLPHGFGHGREGVRLRVASAHPGASINDLTDPLRLDELTGNAALNGTPIELRALEAR
ncbi:MAG: molybdopterin-dependent oxidoreductase [Candidatus Eremiobacteraeota bacterium]|nr:molybdopterin-dependent oxidoreductase [Candidatus Eremiobacteraeota bacterium]